MISKHPDGWTPVNGAFVDPQWSKSLQSDYDLVAARTYQNSEGKTVAVVMTWSRDGIRRAGHLQQICYQASGFTVSAPKRTTVSTKVGRQDAIAFTAYNGNMPEDVMYWRITGGKTDLGTARSRFLATRFDKMSRLAQNILGNMPDNLMVRVSSVRSIPGQPATTHLEYIQKYLEILPEGDRKLIMGQ